MSINNAKTIAGNKASNTYQYARIIRKESKLKAKTKERKNE